MMGTISGSGVANVVTTGQFTIPLMRRFGYRPAFAGGVEATASMGGQIMPPVMGAVAFIMAENLNVPYADIVKAGVVDDDLVGAGDDAQELPLLCTIQRGGARRTVSVRYRWEGSVSLTGKSAR